MSTRSAHNKVVFISPHQHSREYWRLAWEYRQLLWFLARRDLVIRYRQTMAGVLWLLIRPAMQVAIFTIVFGVIAGLPDGGLPYPVLVFSGIVAWTLFNSIVLQSTISLANNHNLITKVHFPRILLPIATIAPNLIDLAISLIALAAVLLWYGLVPSWRLFLLPAPILLVACLGVGIGLWFSAGSVRYRDLRQITPFLLNILLFLSPIGFSSDVARARLGEFGWMIYNVNPLVAGIDLFRWCLLPAGFAPSQDLGRLLISLSVGLLLIALGQWYFRRAERTFADVI